MVQQKGIQDLYFGVDEVSLYVCVRVAHMALAESAASTIVWYGVMILFCVPGMPHDVVLLVRCGTWNAAWLCLFVFEMRHGVFVLW